MKRTVKKGVSLLLALCMLVSLCLPAAAAETLAEVPGVGRVDDGDPAVVFIDGSNDDKVWTWTKAPDTAWGNITFLLIEDADPAPTVYPSVTLTFKGTGIQVYGQAAVNGPLMSAEIDGEPAGNADFFDPSSSSIDGRKVYEKNGLENDEHTLTLTFTRERSSSVAHGKAGLQAAIDYFEVIGPVEPKAVTVVGGTSDKETAAAGETVTVTAGQPTEDETFHHWSSEPAVEFANASASETTFVMPSAAVTVTANYSTAYPAGTTFYVDSAGGNDSNNGTNIDAPWQTLDNVNALTLQPGDRILLKAGSVFAEQSLSLRGSGSEEAPIVVDMYGEGAKPHIKADGAAKAAFVMGNEVNSGTTPYPSIAYGLHIKNMSYITVKNLEITNTNGQEMTVDKANGKFRVGVVVETESGYGVASGIHLDGLYVHDVNGDRQQKTAPNGGIYFITTAANRDVTHATRYDDISIQNCTVADVSRTGISVGSSHSANKWENHSGGMIPEEVKTNFGHTNVLIKNNFVQNAGGDAIVPQFCIAPVIEYNVSDHASQNSGKDGGQYNAAIWPWRCEDALFQFNEAFSTKNNGDGQAYDCDSSRGTTYQYNYSHDNEGGFMLLCQSQSVESTVRYNISQNDHDSLFLVSNTTPADVYNNTFYVGTNLTTIVDGGSPANLKNNIFYNNSGKSNLAGWGNFSYNNNLYYGFDTVPNDPNKIVADPMFVDAGKGGNGTRGDSAIDTLAGYALRENSPAINTGRLIADNGGRDYAGNAIVGYPDIGAMESNVAAESDVEVWTTNSYVNPFQDFNPSTTPMADEEIGLLMGKNERESAQILLRSSAELTVNGVTFSDLSDGGENAIAAENLKYNFVDYHRMSNSEGQSASTTVRWGTDDYPDRLSNDTARTVTAGNAQSIWVTVYAPPGTTAGTYTGTATVNTTAGDFPVTITAEVVDVAIPSAGESAFELSYWQNISGTWNWSGINPDRYIITGIFPDIKEAGKWSDTWWDYVESAADVMEEARVNVLHVQPLELLMDGGSTVTGYDEEGNAQYNFNWSKFDEYIQYFIDRGFIKKLELYHLLNTKYASHTEPTILVPDPDYDAEAGFGYTNRPLKIWEVPSYFEPADGDEMAPAVEAFYRQYVPALTTHLREKGWTDISFQHVEDECISTREQKEYLHMVNMFTELAGDNVIPFGDPIDTNNVDFMLENTTMQFPLSSIFDGSKDKYETWLAQNPGTVMMYTCLNPKGNNLNKFIDKPVWQMRIQSWYSYAVDVTGHLHWAWDAGWSDASKADAEGVDRIKDINEFNWKGDDFVVWPDVENNSVASSIRAASIRDGAEDYEVFYLLSQEGEDYENWAKQQVERVVQSNSSYTTDIETMMAIREQLYRAAAGEIDIYRTVTFSGNGGEPAINPVKGTVDVALGAKMPADPTRAGYLFTGWNTAANGSGESFAANTVVRESITVYAQWISGNDILCFAVNGIVGAIDAENHTVTVKLAHGASVTGLTPVFALSAGASCIPASEETTDFTNPVTYTVTAGDGTAQVWTVTVSLSASAAEDATVTWQAEGGTPAPETLTVPKGSRLAEPRPMTLKNKVFEGWYKEAGLETPWNFSEGTVTENITLYAKWVDEYYRNDFSESTGTWLSVNGETHTKVSLVDDADAEDGKAVYLPSVAQSNRAISLADAGMMVDGTIEMRVKVQGIGGSPTLGISFRSPAAHNYYNAVCLKGGGRHAYGLLADSAGAHADSTPWSDPWTDKTVTFESDRYYTIKLQIQDQAVTLTVDGEVIVDSDDSWAEWSPLPGYVGIYGWGTTSNYTIDYIKMTPDIGDTPVTVTFDAQNGEETTTQDAVDGERLVQPADPAKDGYKFLGWFVAGEENRAWNFASDRVFSDMTLNAKWRELSGENDIIAFKLQEYESNPGVIDADAHTVSVVLPAGAELKDTLTSDIEVSENAAVTPADGEAVTFVDGVAKEYTVTAENGDQQVWKVTVTVTPPPYIPPTGGSSNTTTKTEKNEDGSTTTTVTNKTTGTVTETTKHPDGTVQKVETKKDGSMTSTETRKDGTKVESATTAQGATTATVTVPKDTDGVTVTIPTAEKPSAGKVAVIVKEDGTKEIVKTSVATEGGMRITLTEGAKLEIVDNTKDFGDVPANQWFTDAVQFAASRELFNGTGKDSFAPTADMSRAMLITVLARLDGQDTSKGETWYSASADWAKEQGLTDGAALEDAISREQLAVMLYRYAKAEKTEADLKDFTDAGNVSDWAAEAMAWAVKSGIITGKGGALDPQGNASRAEVATMLQRFIAQ